MTLSLVRTELDEEGFSFRSSFRYWTGVSDVDPGVLRPVSLTTPFANVIQFAGVSEKSLSKPLMKATSRCRRAAVMGVVIEALT